MKLIVGAVYQHKKGKFYKLIATATHSETLEECVCYQALYGEGKVWIRPLEMFTDGRFTLVEEPEMLMFCPVCNTKLIRHDYFFCEKCGWTELFG